MQSTEAPFQINLKTPGGTLLNVRAWTEAELDVSIEALTARIVNIVALEQTVSALGALSNAGMNPQPVAQQAHYAANEPPTYTPAMGSTPMCACGAGPMRMVPAGISKAGKPYKSFFACPKPQGQSCNYKV